MIQINTLRPVFFFNVGITTQDWINSHPVGHQFVDRRWENCCQFNFMSAGYEPRFHKEVAVLELGYYILAYVSAKGYVGVGQVVSKPVEINKFVIPKENPKFGGVKLYELQRLLCPTNLFCFANNDKKCEHVVGVNWLGKIDWDCNTDTKPAIWEPGKFFYYRKTVCSMDKQNYTINKVCKVLL